MAVTIGWKIPPNRKKVISPPLDYRTIIAETTQLRQVLRINLNKFNEVKALSAIANLSSYVNYFFFEVEGLEVRAKLLVCSESRHPGLGGITDKE
ncbi:MAG TPA: hypothetical protein DEG17_21700 [Cyanobacteria bacterium UBA11149]|nr:hypothetical protein [Cyanobacteria bacterium UBA11367]HBE60743.1 hypothetical protein [Cyanobacteria bacterium UBA11366]HBK65474.1 hypothetical protein [Cyanobacteria bacterium UBA11166]HBR72471.1 hypothetical protein [Cyanobacteria bacterium UBA11159]HBS68258.1 hypothetical protein [Cyanobacteria bacterium UBA11153]HBW91401.1 hypothetical protein [Cyanobacteria bacterium UBA11149]